jgi:hypothetical protein
MGKRGPQPELPTKAERERVRELAGVGLPQTDIALVMGRSKHWLQDRCRAELDDGIAETHAKVGLAIVDMAMQGNVAAAIFYLKTRAGWSEKHVHEHSGPSGGPITHKHVHEMSDADLIRVIEGQVRVIGGDEP